MRVRGLEAPVEILRDDLGIPHVRGRGVHDAFFGQGFVHAQDRLWQMCHDRAKAAGRLSAWLGPRTRTLDVFLRRLDLGRSTRRDHEAFDAETRSVLEAYAAGVNAFLATGERPVELELLGVEPEPWEPWHTGAVLKVRHVLMGNFDRKLWRLRLARALGPRTAATIGAADGRDETVIVPVGGRTVARADPGVLAVPDLVDGSNSWAVHGDRSASGKPLVAGDPHRLIEVPNVYYQNHVACPDFDAIGLSMAGVPGMFHFGHNAEVAWCVTHAMADTQDLYLERFDADGRYAFRDEWLSPERRTETIEVRGEAPLEIDVTVTRHGPVLFGDPADGTAIAMRWTGTDGPNTSLRTILPMLRVRSVDELDEVMRDWVDPCNSFVMADLAGTIGYVHRGRVPVRSRANGWTPVPGWTGEHEWTGEIPYEQLPRLRDPEAGFIVTANNAVVDDDAQYLGMDYAAPNRARRILERVAALEDATAEDMAAIHTDELSLDALTMLEALEGLDAGGALRPLLAGWNGTMDPAAAAPSAYAALRDELAGLLVEREPLARVVDNPFPEEPFPYSARTWIRGAVVRLLAGDDTSVLDGSSWSELIEEASRRAGDRLAARLGPDPAAWSWERLHVTAPVHPLSRVFPDAGLDPPAVSCGGDRDCVHASGSTDGLGVEHTSVARYVFDLGDWDRSGWIVPLGSSGDPRSPHYADQAPDWAAVRLRPMTYSWDRIEAGAESRQVLEPR